MATERKRKLFFELTKSEKENRLKSALLPVLRRNMELNQPVVFRNSQCERPTQFIHRYPNGEQVLVEIDMDNLTEKLGNNLALMVI